MKTITVTIERDYEQCRSIIDGLNVARDAILMLPDDLTPVAKERDKFIMLTYFVEELRNAFIDDMEDTIRQLKTT
jgi:hypothetical protein